MPEVSKEPPPRLLEINVSMQYPASQVNLGPVCLSVGRGEIVGLAGESGSGKSSVGLTIMGLLGMRGGRATGSVLFEGRDLLQCSQPDLRTIRGKRLSLILQNPTSALNPGLRLKTQFAEAWRAHSADRNGWIPAAIRTLQAVGLSAEPSFFNKYPRELSTGMAQRVLLGISLLHAPALLIADEPTSALDVITQAEVLALFRHLNKDSGLSLLLISHDILGLLSVCDRIAIMRQGEIVETATPHDLLHNPIHPYVQKVVNSLPIDVLRSVANAALLRRSE
jgi:ABC-type dipeptide/oligopeptide/nickel transport system ATPase component